MVQINKNILILVGLVSLAYIIIFLLSPKDITDYTIADIDYWHESSNRLLLKTAYEYNSKENITSFPMDLADWKGYDFKYSDDVYKTLNADILLSRSYVKDRRVLYLDIINSKTGESFHNPQICLTGAGWNIDNESVVEFKIADPPNPFTKLYAKRLDATKENEQQVMIYWFMFKKFSSKDAVTMVRISAHIGLNGSTIDTTFDRIKSFVEGQLFDAMYKKGDADEITNAEYISRQYGNKGILATIGILLVPIGLIITGVRKKDS